MKILVYDPNKDIVDFIIDEMHYYKTDDISIEEIGKGSTVQLFVGVGEQTYKKKRFLVCYLKSINVLDLVEKTAFNPFTSDEVQEF